MTQTKSCSNQKIFLSLYKNALKRIGATSALYLLICFISFPVSYISEVSQRQKKGVGYYPFIGDPSIYTTSSIIFYFIIVIGGAIILSVLANNFMHNKRAVDVFHALPVKRHQQLMANFFAVITTLLTSQAICYGVVAVTAKINFDISLGAIFIEFIRVAIITVLIAAISFFSCVCCATSLDSTIFSTAFLAIVPAYTALITILSMSYADGYKPDSQILYTALKFSPAVMIYQIFFNDSRIEYSFSLSLIYIIAAIAIMALSCFIYKIRKSESAQSATSKNIVYKFIIIAASVGTGMVFGLSYSAFNVYEAYPPTIKSILIPSLLFTIVVFLVFNAIISRNAKPNKNAIINLGISLIIVIAFIFIGDNRFNAIKMYVPDVEEVKTVRVELDSQYSNISKSVLDENGSIQVKDNRFDNAVFEDEKTINRVLDIHQIIVEEKNNNSDDYIYETFRIEYTLKNGKTVKRDYYNIPKNVINKWLELTYSEEFKTKLYPVISEPADKVLNFEIKDGFGRNYQTLNLNDEQRNILYNAIAQDTLNMTSQMRIQEKGVIYAKIAVNYKILSSKKINKEYKNLAYTIDERPEYTGVVFNVTQSSINTINALKQIGLEQYAQLNIPEDVNVIVKPSFEFFNSILAEENASSFENYNSSIYDVADIYHIAEGEFKRYEDIDKIKQVVDKSSTAMYLPSSENRYFDVFFVPKDFNPKDVIIENTMSYYLSYKDAPDFIKQDFKELEP